MTSNLKKENLLFSWKEIAGYLACDRRTCIRWEKKHGLPVHRVSGSPKSRVYAHKDELDAWLAGHADKRFIQKKAGLSRFKPKSILYLPLFLFAVALIVGIVLWRSPDRQPYDFRIEKSQLIILNKVGKELWSFDTKIKNLYEEKEYRSFNQFRRRRDNYVFWPELMIKDVNNDGWNEVMFSIQTQDETNEGVLLCFDRRGEVLWTFEGGRRLKYGEKIYSRDYRIKGFDTADINRDGVPELIVVATHNNDFPTQLVVLDSRGRVLGEYWNAGRIMDFVLVDLEEDGQEDVVLAAMNNEYRKPCLIVLDAAEIRGGSPQKDPFYVSLQLEPGTEKFYILFPRIEFAIIKGVMETMMWVERLENRRLRAVASLSDIIYELNFKLELEDVRLSHTFELKYQQAWQEGKVKDKLDKPALRKKLAQDLLYYNGENWTSHPTKTSRWKKAE